MIKYVRHNCFISAFAIMKKFILWFLLLLTVSTASAFDPYSEMMDKIELFMIENHQKNFSYSSETKSVVVEWLHDNALTKFDNVWDFWWDRITTRWEAAKFFTEFWLLYGKEQVRSREECVFGDIDHYDHTLQPYIVQACQLWLMKWDGENFFPERLITDVEWVTVIVRVVFGMQDETWSPWRRENYDIANSMLRLDGIRMKWLGVDRGSIAAWLYKAYTTELDDFIFYNKDIWKYLRVYSDVSWTMRILPLEWELTEASCLLLNQDKEILPYAYPALTWFMQGNMCINTWWSTYSKKVWLLDEEWNTLEGKPVWDLSKEYFLKGSRFFVSSVKIWYSDPWAEEWISYVEVYPDASWNFEYMISKEANNLFEGYNYYVIQYINPYREATLHNEWFRDRYVEEYPSQTIDEDRLYEYFSQHRITEVYEPLEATWLPSFSLDQITLSDYEWNLRVEAEISNVGNADHLIKWDELTKISCNFVEKETDIHVNIGTAENNLNRDFAEENLIAWGEPINFIIDSQIPYWEELRWKNLWMTCYIDTPVTDEVLIHKSTYRRR